MPIYTANGAGKDTMSLFKEMYLAHLASRTATELHMKTFHDGIFHPQFDQYVENSRTHYKYESQPEDGIQKKFRKFIQEVPSLWCPVRFC